MEGQQSYVMVISLVAMVQNTATIPSFQWAQKTGTKPRPPGIPVLKVKNFPPPPLSVKIPENSCYKNTAYIHPVCKPKVIRINKMPNFA